jgi:N-acetylglucosaminyltransferase
MRVSMLSFLPMGFMMPITYALLTPLALFTLDSGSWETRGKPAPVPTSAPPLPPPQPELSVHLHQPVRVAAGGVQS